MTRINTVDVECLTDQHLMAEYRELPMVNASLRRSKASKKGVNGIPEQYTLNGGHVKFFYNKGKFLYNRYFKMIKELQNRGYNIDPEARTIDWDVFGKEYWNDWTPTNRDHSINMERIVFRLREKPEFYRYNKDKIDSSFIENLEREYINEG